MLKGKKKRLREAKGLFLLQFQFTVITTGESQWCQELEVPGHVTHHQMHNEMDAGVQLASSVHFSTLYNSQPLA